MKKLLFFIMIIALAIPVFAQNATVERVSGKVEVLKTGGKWVAVAVGDVIPIGATISTGFRSSAVLMVAGSQITVMALTRMSIEDLAETNESISTSLNLRTGKVQASVASTSGKTTDFTLRSPVSTAAVRGTEFVFDGYRLEVIAGVVSFFSKSGEVKAILAGNASTTSGNDSPSNPEDDQQDNSTITTDTSGGQGGSGYTGTGTKGSLVIVIES